MLSGCRVIGNIHMHSAASGAPIPVKHGVVNASGLLKTLCICWPDRLGTPCSRASVSVQFLGLWITAWEIKALFSSGLAAVDLLVPGVSNPVRCSSHRCRILYTPFRIGGTESKWSRIWAAVAENHILKQKSILGWQEATVETCYMHQYTSQAIHSSWLKQNSILGWQEAVVKTCHVTCISTRANQCTPIGSDFCVTVNSLSYWAPPTQWVPGALPPCKTAETWSWPLTSFYCRGQEWCNCTSASPFVFMACA
jgi:hypothetical protein